MKKLILALLLFPVLGSAQAKIGKTLEEIKELYPNKTFEIDYANDGTKYASAEMDYGTFTYYFEKNNGVAFRCIQIPTDLIALNAQVENYNSKYVILSESSWKAYLEGGFVMKINLEYDKEHNVYVFYYN